MPARYRISLPKPRSSGHLLSVLRSDGRVVSLLQCIVANPDCWSNYPPPPKAVEESGNTPTDIKYTDGVGEESLNRFDEKKQKKRHSRQRNNNNRENGNSNTPRNEKNERNGERGGQRPFRNGPRQDQRRDSRPIQRPKPRTDQHSQSKTEQ